VIVIGSGFIGCEIAASLRARGLEVTLFSDEAAPNVGRLGADAAAEIAGWLSADGVALRLGAEVDRIERSGGELAVIAGAERASAPVVVMATGVTPRGELAAAAGLELDGGAIPADAAMRSTVDGLLAAGDVARANNAAAGRPLRVEHWGDALGQGAVAGRTAAGMGSAWDEVPGFWSTIGVHTLKYAAWGDGYDESRFVHRPNGGFEAWYGRNGTIVGVLAHDADDAYERGRALIAGGASWS
jgi:NADPH-dependent 2,4-dienoyl-CoA reductase/sulfur reductase-like enzyme